MVPFLYYVKSDLIAFLHVLSENSTHPLDTTFKILWHKLLLLGVLPFPTTKHVPSFGITNLILI